MLDTEEIIELPLLQIDLKQYKVTYEMQEIVLPPKEMELLYFLASQPNRVFTRQQLLDQIWGLDFEGDPRTVDVHIKRLREKLGDSNPYWVRAAPKDEVGVARPSAHGQAITRTAIAFSSAAANSPGATKINQMRNMTTAMPTTIGTKIPEITSAMRFAQADATRLKIRTAAITIFLFVQTGEGWVWSRGT